MKYKVGDKVKVRKWDDMVSEFDVDASGDIELPGIFFTKKMEKFCGKIVTIQEREVDLDGKAYYEILEDTEHEYDFSDDMFEDDFMAPILIGVDVYNIVKELSGKFLGDNLDMTDNERAAYNLGKEQILNILKKSFNELFLEEDNVKVPIYIVHVPGLNTPTDFGSIVEVQERFGEDKI